MQEQYLTIFANFMTTYQTLKTAGIISRNEIAAADAALFIFCVIRLQGVPTWALRQVKIGFPLRRCLHLIKEFVSMDI